jgi:hypothetical protein
VASWEAAQDFLFLGGERASMFAFPNLVTLSIVVQRAGSIVKLEAIFCSVV